MFDSKGFFRPRVRTQVSVLHDKSSSMISNYRAAGPGVWSLDRSYGTANVEYIPKAEESRRREFTVADRHCMLRSAQANQ